MTPLHPPHPSTPPTPRLVFLDWVRVLAFALLVPYHVGMYYVSWPWHVKSAQLVPALEPFMRLSSPWRMDLLFLISGVASACLWGKLGGGRRFLRERLARLGWPLLFGLLVVVPPQAYFEVVDKHAYGGSFIDFMLLYLRGFNGFCSAPAHCLILPTWNHLWFLPYLISYTALLWALMHWRGTGLAAAGRWADASLRVPVLLCAPIVFLLVTRWALAPRWPVTHALVDDLFAHSQYVAFFALGAVGAHTRALWPRLSALRWVALGLAVASWAALIGAAPLNNGLRAALFSTQQWCAIVAALGFAQRHLRHDNASLRYCTQAVFAVYILHQTVIILLARALAPWQLSVAVEGPLLVVLTFAFCLAGFEAVRRVRWLRPAMGLRARPGSGCTNRTGGTRLRTRPGHSGR